MRLIRNRGAVARRSYSFHCAWISAVFLIAGIVSDTWWLLPQEMLPLSPHAFLWMGIAFTILGGIGRFVDQNL